LYQTDRMTDKQNISYSKSDKLTADKVLKLSRSRAILSVVMLPIVLSAAAAILCSYLAVHQHPAIGYCFVLIAILLSGLLGNYKSSLIATAMAFCLLNIITFVSQYRPGIKDFADEGGYLTVALLQCLVFFKTEMAIRKVRQKDLLERRAIYRREKRRNEMIQMAIHELKSPITSVSSYIQLALKCMGKECETQEYQFLEHAFKQVSRINLFVSDMTEMAQIKSGAIQFKFEMFDLRTCISEVVEVFNQTYSNHQFNINAPLYPITIDGDCVRISQVVNNFISNAIKYSPDQNIVDIRILDDEREVIIEVIDYGIGIAAEHQENIFCKFYRAHTGSGHNYPGWGLGLFIASEIIVRHNGKLGVKNSSPGKGSTFWMSLPKPVV
jgi:signal transduction histidine kinase